MQENGGSAPLCAGRDIGVEIRKFADHLLKGSATRFVHIVPFSFVGAWRWFAATQFSVLHMFL